MGTRIRDEESETEEDDDDFPVRLLREGEVLTADGIVVNHEEDLEEVNDDEAEDNWVEEDWEQEALAAATEAAEADDVPQYLGVLPELPDLQSPENQFPRENGNGVPGRQYPYMRVPNHDHVVIIPGQKMMVPMARGSPLVGRVNETEEEVRTNWTRVYIPNRFRLRIIGLLIFQWLCGILLAMSIIVGPLYVGRLTFSKVYEYMTSTSNVAVSDTSSSIIEVNVDNVTGLLNETAFISSRESNTRLPARPDLPVHDLFSFSLGLFVVIGTFALLSQIEKTLHVFVTSTRSMLQVRIPVPQSLVPPDGHAEPAPAHISGQRGSISAEPVNRVDTGLRPDRPRHMRLNALFFVFRQWWIDVGSVVLVSALKFFFLAAWGSFILPLLFGLVFQFYVVMPSTSSRQQTRIIFVLQDWALGIMYTKIIYMLVLAGPDTDFRRALASARDQLRDGGLNAVNIRSFTMGVLFPVIMICTVLVLPPLGFLTLAEFMFGNAMDTAGAPAYIALIRYTVPIALFLSYLAEAFRAVKRLFGRWMEQVRDEQYLVGRKLHNLNDNDHTRE